MFWFIFKLITGVVLLLGVTRLVKSEWFKKQTDGGVPWLGTISRILGALLILWAIWSSSVAWPNSGEIMVMKRMFGKPLPPGKIVATDGEMGPQAKIITAGFHFIPLIRLVNDLETVKVYTVPAGQCAIMSAKDGAYVPDGGAFADPWTTANASAMVNDAEYFLKNGGQRGVQSTVLRPGSYTLNPYLWEAARLIPAVRVEQGMVGVVKSSVYAAVDFGAFQHPKPASMDPIKLKSRIPTGSAAVNIVAVGGSGVWEEALMPNLYYINTDCYKITMVPVSAMVFTYKGGYTKRQIEVTVDDKTGSITQKELEKQPQTTPEGSDEAVFVKPEGWDVAQEARVLAQISPADAPLVVAGLGLNDQNAIITIDHRVVTPVVRSVVRDVMGGKSIKITSQQPVLGTNGIPLTTTNGEPVIHQVVDFRPVKVLDLLENRSSLEEAILTLAKAQADHEFVSILEFRLSESAIPPELLVARKREQLAQQIQKAWKQEEQAQVQRQQLENQRAQAEQQSTLVVADIALQAATKLADAAKIKATGEKLALIAIAEGQKAQKDVLGDEATVKLRMFEVSLKAFQDLAKDNPQVITAALANMSKLVPNVVVNNGNSGGSGEGMAAVLGHFLNPGATSDKPAETKK